MVGEVVCIIARTCRRDKSILHALEDAVLQFPQAAVQAVLREQGAVRPALADPAVVHHQDLVHVLQSHQAVGDEQGGPVLHQPEQGIQHFLLRQRVEICRGLIQDEDRRLLQQSPGDRQPLAFTAAQARSLLADEGLVALGQAGDEVVDVRRPGSGFHLLLSQVR